MYTAVSNDGHMRTGYLPAVWFILLPTLQISSNQSGTKFPQQETKASANSNQSQNH